MSAIFVPPDGYLTSSVACIGQNPGKTEINPFVMKPFSGYSGNLLNKWWSKLGVTRSQFYLDNLIPYMVEPEKLDKKELDHWGYELQKRLAQMPNVNVIVPMGDYACSALIGKGNNKYVPKEERVGITKLRGSIYTYTTLSGRTCKVIPTQHPSSTFIRGSGRMGVTKGVLEKRLFRDWERIVYESKFQEAREPLRQYYICQGEEQAKWFEWRVANAGTEAIMSIDIETVDQISCVGFSFDPSWSFTFPTMSRQEQDLYFPYIKRICESPIQKVLQTGLYDTYWLRYYGINVNNYIWDLGYAHAVIDPTNNHSLDFLSSWYLPFHRYWKDEAKSPEEVRKYASQPEALYTYNGMDNCIQRELVDYIKADLTSHGLMEFYFSHIVALLDPLLDTSLHGIQVNRDKMKWLRDKALERAQQVREELAVMAGEDLMAKKDFSKKKLQNFFHVTLNLPKKYKLTKKKDGKSKSETLGALALAQMAHENPDVALKPAQLVVDYRAETKEIGSWLNEEKLDGDNRVRCQYSTMTEAGRLSSKENPRGTGYNLQNTKTREKAWRRGGDKENIRSIYIPDEGCVLLEVDLSQVEHRQCLMYTRSPRLIEIANRHPAEYDAHKHNASMAFKIPEDQITKEQRFFGKGVSHGAERAMSGKKMSEKFLAEEDLIVLPGECQKMIDNFLQEMHEISEIYFPWVRSEIMTKGRLVNSWGRVWDVKGETMDDDLYRRGYSFPMQCCDDKTEVLTTKGFVPFPELTPEHIVAQYDPSNRIISMHLPLKIHVDDYTGPMCLFEGTRLSMCVTPNHRVLYKAPKSNIVNHANNLMKHKRLKIPVAGFREWYIEDDLLSNDKVRLLIAVQADGCYKEQRIEWHFTKQRKVKRLKQLLSDLGLHYHEYYYAPNKATYITLSYGLVASYLNKYLPNKQFSWSILAWKQELREAFLNELVFWDGLKAANNWHSFWYDSTIKLNSDIVQAVAIMTGRRAHQVVIPKTKEHHNDVHRVYISKTLTTFPSKIEYMNYSGKVYCVTTESGFFVIRRNGKVCITGNSECADLMNQWGFIPVYHYLKASYTRIKSKINIQRHDALIMSVPFEHTWEVARFTLDCLGRPREIMGNLLVVPATVKVGRNDAEGKEWKRLPRREEFLGELEVYLKS